MDRLTKFRYGIAVFYAVFAYIMSYTELAIVILPFLIYTERKIEWKIRTILSIVFLLIMSSIFIIAAPINITMFRMIIITSLFLTLILFEDAEYINIKAGEKWIITVSELLLEFFMITLILSHIQGVVW